MSECTNAPVAKCFRIWISNWQTVSGFLSKWVDKYSVNDIREWLNEWVSVRMSEWMNEWMNKWVNQRMYAAWVGWMDGWVNQNELPVR